MINSNEDLYFLTYDVETTGLNKSEDRICEISWVVMDNSGKAVEYESQLIYPQRDIPHEATLIHGIRNVDVLGKPTFEDFIPKWMDIFQKYDPMICGFNNERFDDQIMENEFRRLDINMDIRGMRGVDVYKLYTKLKPRDLHQAALDFLGEEKLETLKKRFHEIAGDRDKEDPWHSSLFDVMVTSAVMVHMFKQHQDQIPQQPDEFDRWLNKTDPDWIDMDGKFKYNENGQACVNFGKKHKGTPVIQVADEDPGYFEWMLEQDFPNDTKRITYDILSGKPPPRR